MKNHAKHCIFFETNIARQRKLAVGLGTDFSSWEISKECKIWDELLIN